MPHVGSRDIHAELLDGSWNFKDFLRPLDIRVTGITSTAKEEAAHVWRIVDRKTLVQAGFQEGAVQVQHPDWRDLPPSSSDSILLTKSFMHSQNYSQNPILLIPGSLADKLSKEDWGADLGHGC